VFVHRLPRRAQLWIHRFNHALIAGFGGLAAWYSFKLCLLNRTLTTPGLQINLAWLYASAVVGGILITVYGLAVMISPPPRGELQH
jgi:TRAP-type C4-dicarboxylate transport system permease small subunit